MKKNIFLCCIIFTACSNRHQIDNTSTGFVNKSKDSITISSEENSLEEKIDFQDFYTSFRKAIMENDSVALVKYVHFPLKINGYEDQDPIFYIEQPLFDRAFNEVINLSYDYDDEKDISISLKDLIIKEKNVTKLPYYSEYGETERNFGNINFNKINDQWKLTSMYLNSKEFNRKKEH